MRYIPGHAGPQGRHFDTVHTAFVDGKSVGCGLRVEHIRRLSLDQQTVRGVVGRDRTNFGTLAASRAFVGVD